MTGGFLPPRAPDAEEDVPPPRWEADPKEADGLARVVVATKSDVPEVVQAGEHPPRNTQALASLWIALAGVALLIVSIGTSALVSLAIEGIGLWLGREGRRRAQREGIGGSRAARAGVIVAIVGCVLCVLAAVAWALVLFLDLDVDFDRDGPSAPTELSTIAVLLRGHL